MKSCNLNVVKYLHSHPSIGVQYSASAQVKQKGVEVLKEKGGRLGEGKPFLTCFTDATWASEKDDSSSLGGYICIVGGGPFYHPTSRPVFPSHDVTLDESVPFYHLFPYRSVPPPPQTLFLVPDPLPGPAPVQEAVGSGIPQGVASGGAASGGAEPGGAESEGAETGGAEPGGVETRGAEPGGAEPEGVEPRGASSEGAESEGAVPQGSASPLPAPSPYAEQSGSLTERCEPASRPVLPVRPARHVPCSRPPPVPGTHAMTLRPSSVPLRVPLLAPPESSLPEVPNPESDRALATSPTVARLLATAVTDPLFESAIASALVAELLDFAVACRLDYTTALVAESESTSPPSVGGECVLGTDVLEDRQEDFECLAAAVPRFASMLLAPEQDPDAPDIPTPRSYAEAITDPYSFQWQAAMDAKKASWKSTCTYVDEVPPPGANIVDGMWIFRVKRSPRSPPALKACYVARGFSQQQGVDYFQTFSPTPKMTTLRVLLHVAAQRDYELPSLDFSTTFMQGSLHEEICLRRPPCFTESFPAGTQWSLRRLVYGVRQAPREWHHTLRTTLAALGFAAATADPSLFLRTDTSLPPFYVLVYVDDLIFATVKLELQKRHTCTDLGELRSYLGLQITRDRARRTITLTQSHMVHQVLQRFGFQFSSPQPTPLSTSHSLSAPPSDESVEPSGPYPELVGCLIYVMTCTRPNLAYPLSLLARYVDPGRHRKVHWDAAKRVLRYLCGTSGMGLVLGGRGPVVLTGHADASWVDDSATQRLSKGYTFSLGSGSVSWRSTRSSSVLSSSCEAEMYAGAMAVMELHWLTYLLTDLGELPRSPPVLYVDNKAMIALCKDHKLEHRTKHIALRYFLARDLQQHGQLHLAYMSTWANTADIFTKALLVLRLCGDFVIHAKLALLFLTSLLAAPFDSPMPLVASTGASADASAAVSIPVTATTEITPALTVLNAASVATPFPNNALTSDGAANQTSTVADASSVTATATGNANAGIADGREHERDLSNLLSERDAEVAALNQRCAEFITLNEQLIQDLSAAQGTGVLGAPRQRKAPEAFTYLLLDAPARSMPFYLEWAEFREVVCMKYENAGVQSDVFYYVISNDPNKEALAMRKVSEKRSNINSDAKIYGRGPGGCVPETKWKILAEENVAPSTSRTPLEWYCFYEHVNRLNVAHKIDQVAAWIKATYDARDVAIWDSKPPAGFNMSLVIKILVEGYEFVIFPNRTPP
ncbi:unnamed protein product [Closterium sp. NIES-53]